MGKFNFLIENIKIFSDIFKNSKKKVIKCIGVELSSIFFEFVDNHFQWFSFLKYYERKLDWCITFELSVVNIAGLDMFSDSLVGCDFIQHGFYLHFFLVNGISFFQ
jgi:hypothetical protein